MQLNVEAYSLEVMDSLAVHAGFKAAMLMVAAFGGTDVYVPEKMSPNHRIAQLIGLPAAQFLAQHFGNIELRIPLLSEYERVKKICLVVHLHDREHACFRAIAEQLGLSVGAVAALYQQGRSIAPTRRNFKSTRYERRYDFQCSRMRKLATQSLMGNASAMFDERCSMSDGVRAGTKGEMGAGSLAPSSSRGGDHPQQLALFDDFSDGLV